MSSGRVIRPQAVELVSKQEGCGKPNCFAARIASLNFLGDVVETEVMCGDQKLLLMLSPYAPYAPGDEIALQVAPENCVIVPPETTSSGGAAE